MARSKPEENHDQEQPVGTVAAKMIQTSWSPRPSFADQAIKMPGTFRVGPEQFAVFDLSSGDELADLNSFMLRTHPVTAPEIVVHGREEQFNSLTGKWVVLIRYSAIEYMSLA